MRYLLLLSMLLASCSGLNETPSKIESQPRIQESPMSQQLTSVPALNGEPITVGVYGFLDQTGQRAPNSNFASLSSAVTQGADAWVIDALLKVGDGQWFNVVERGILDDLIKERQLIRSTRENFQPDQPDTLDPLKFAGLLVTGSIVGYDSNVITGGTGARYLGIGATTEYRIDTVTVALRIVSVSTGRVLASVAIEKSIASHQDSANVFRFLDLGTNAVEAETGYSANEPRSYAVRSAIEAGIVELIYQGERNSLWKFKEH